MKKIYISLTIVFLALSMQAQDVIWKMTYDVAVPFAASRDYADQFSWRGLSLDFDRFVGDNLAVGFGFSWNLFLEKEPDSDYFYEELQFHGTQVNYLNNIPLVARISWYQPLDFLELFASLGIGTVWQENRTEIGTFAFTGSGWQFALTPEVGTIFPIGNTYIAANLKYVMGFETEQIQDLSYLSFGLGFAW